MMSFKNSDLHLLEIGNEKAEGGFANVYPATHKHTKQKYALKKGPTCPISPCTKGESLFSVKIAEKDDLNNKENVLELLRKQFEKEGNSLSKNPKITVSGEEWEVTDERKKWIIKKENSELKIHFSDRLCQRMKREAEILEKIRNPHVVTFYGSGIIDHCAAKTDATELSNIFERYADKEQYTEPNSKYHFHWLLMEYIKEDLSTFMTKRWKNFSLEQRYNFASFIGIALCKGLQSLHENKYYHRDIKPENILIEEVKEEASGSSGTLFMRVWTAIKSSLRAIWEKLRGKGIPEIDNLEKWKIKIADLGLVSKEDSDVSMEGMGAGTSAYLAPEQCADLREGKAPADIFALGCVIYELVSEGETYKKNRAYGRVFTRTACAYTFHDKKIPESPFQNILEQMLQEDQKDRPSLANIEKELQEIQSKLLKKEERKKPNKKEEKEKLNKKIENLSKKFQRGLIVSLSIAALLIVSVFFWLSLSKIEKEVNQKFSDARKETEEKIKSAKEKVEAKIKSVEEKADAVKKDLADTKKNEITPLKTEVQKLATDLENTKTKEINPLKKKVEDLEKKISDISKLTKPHLKLTPSNGQLQHEIKPVLLPRHLALFGIEVGGVNPVIFAGPLAPLNIPAGRIGFGKALFFLLYSEKKFSANAMKAILKDLCKNPNKLNLQDWTKWASDEFKEKNPNVEIEIQIYKGP